MSVIAVQILSVHAAGSIWLFHILEKIKHMSGKKENIKRKFNIFTYFSIVLAVTVLVLVAILVRNYSIRRNAEKEFERLAEKVNQLENSKLEDMQTAGAENTQAETAGERTTEETGLGVSIPEKTLDWTEMMKLNPDIYAWICIPGTDIDYPILQHPTDDSYYLNYNMNGTRGYPGCIYTEKLNRKDFTDFDTVIYGHNMRNESMFADLHKYEDETFFRNNPYVFLYTGNKVFVYEIFAAYMGNDVHILYGNDFTIEAGRQEYLDSILNNRDEAANIRTEVPVSGDSHLITLSTCVKRETDRRFLVQAVLLNEDDL